jgi:hypothetical protein
MNPSGAMCLGASNTNSIVLGHNAIAIDNSKTPAQIYINEAPFFYIPVPGTLVKDFSNLIPSRAGFNPSGTLRIAYKNTEFLDMGLLKIDNTVVPPQVFANGAALPPVESPDDTDQYSYYVLPEATGNGQTLEVYFQPDPVNPINRVVAEIASVDPFNNGGLEIYRKGIYEVEFQVNVNSEDVLSEQSLDGSVFLKAMYPDNVLNPSTGAHLSANEMIPQSNIMFSKGNTTSETITFNIYTTGSNTIIGVGTDMIGEITLKSPSFVKIKQIGIYS